MAQSFILSVLTGQNIEGLRPRGLRPKKLMEAAQLPCMRSRSSRLTTIKIALMLRNIPFVQASSCRASS
eukprot:911645-Pelagomonas_calceolata.AAC.2